MDFTPMPTALVDLDKLMSLCALQLRVCRTNGVMNGPRCPTIIIGMVNLVPSHQCYVNAKYFKIRQIVDKIWLYAISKRAVVTDDKINWYYIHRNGKSQQVDMPYYRFPCRENTNLKTIES